MRQLGDRIGARYGGEERLLSQHKAATAVVTAEAQVPMMTGTRSTSISLRAAFTAASGLVWVVLDDEPIRRRARRPPR